MINILKKQFGFTILLLTMGLLIVSTLLILFTARYSALQQKITSDYYQKQQAHQAAQAGIEAAIPYFQSNYTAIVAAGSSGFLQPYMNSNTQNVALSNGSKYTFIYSNSTANNYQLITITSTGVSSDGTATSIIVQKILAYSSGTTPPTQTLTTQGNIQLRDSSSFTNTSNNMNIVTGGSVSISSSATTVTSSGTSSNASTIGSDISQNNSSIANLSTDAFLLSTIGVNQSTLANSARYTFTNNGSTNYSSVLNGKQGTVIWINQTAGAASISGNTVIGSTSSPVVLVVNGGQLRISDNAVIYGLVIVLNSTSSDIERMRENAIINGALIATNDIHFNDNSKVNYNSTILNALPSTGGSASYTKLPGSWRDF